MNNFLLRSNNIMPELLLALQKIKEEVQVKIKAKKKQATLKTYFTKAS